MANPAVFLPRLRTDVYYNAYLRRGGRLPRRQARCVGQMWDEWAQSVSDGDL